MNSIIGDKGLLSKPYQIIDRDDLGINSPDGDLL